MNLTSRLALWLLLPATVSAMAAPVEAGAGPQVWVNSIGISVIRIPAGSFLMGSPNRDAEGQRRREAAAPGGTQSAVPAGKLSR